MGRGRPPSRRRIAIDGDDKDDGDIYHSPGSNALATNNQASPDLKFTLQIADLSDRTRERQTAHDREAERAVDFAKLNGARKCNWQGSEEAKTAAANQIVLSKWNSLSGNDATTSLSDIARGQYHRQATSQKVQAEVRQLRMEGKEIISASIDAPRARSTYQNSQFFSKQTRDRLSLVDNLSKSPRPLDPAVNPSRVYNYKSGQSYSGASRQGPVRGQGASRGGRSGRGTGRGGHSTQFGRNSQADITANSTRSSPRVVESVPQLTSLPGGPRDRLTAQRRFQDGSRPLPALMENPKPPPLKLAVGSSPTVQIVTQEDHGISPQGNFVKTTLIQPPDTTTIQHQPLSNSETSTQPETSHHVARSASVMPQKIAGGNLAENFGEWYKSKSLADSRGHQHTTSNTPTNSKDIVRDELPVTIPRFELHCRPSISLERSDDQLTTGRLSPVDFDRVFDDTNSLFSNVSDTISIKKNATQFATAICNSESRRLDLMDEEISQVEQAALSSLEDLTSKSTKRHNPFNHPDDTRLSLPDEATSEVLDRLEDAGSPLQPRSPNKTRNSEVGQLKSALLSNPTPPVPAADAVAQARLNTSYYNSTLIGNESSFGRRASVQLTAGNDLYQSRYATTSGIRRTQAGPGYGWLLRDLAMKNISVNSDRRPDQPVFTRASSSTAFNQYREPSDSAAASDDDEL